MYILHVISSKRQNRSLVKKVNKYYFQIQLATSMTFTRRSYSTDSRWAPAARRLAKDSTQKVPTCGTHQAVRLGACRRHVLSLWRVTCKWRGSTERAVQLTSPWPGMNCFDWLTHAGVAPWLAETYHTILCRNVSLALIVPILEVPKHLLP